MHSQTVTEVELWLGIDQIDLIFGWGRLVDIRILCEFMNFFNVLKTNSISVAMVFFKVVPISTMDLCILNLLLENVFLKRMIEVIKTNKRINENLIYSEKVDV